MLINFLKNLPINEKHSPAQFEFDIIAGRFSAKNGVVQIVFEAKEKKTGYTQLFFEEVNPIADDFYAIASSIICSSKAEYRYASTTYDDDDWQCMHYRYDRPEIDWDSMAYSNEIKSGNIFYK